MILLFFESSSELSDECWQKIVGSFIDSFQRMEGKPGEPADEGSLIGRSLTINTVA